MYVCLFVFGGGGGGGLVFKKKRKKKEAKPIEGEYDKLIYVTILQ